MEPERNKNNSVEAASEIDDHNTRSAPTTKLTKEVLEKIASDSDSVNFNANSYSRKSKSGSPSKVGTLEYDDNSTSELSKVTSPEHPNSVSLSDIYISSDAETEKMDLEEDESRVKLSEMASNSIESNGNDKSKQNDDNLSKTVKQEYINNGVGSYIQESAPKLATPSKDEGPIVQQDKPAETEPEPVPYEDDAVADTDHTTEPNKLALSQNQDEVSVPAEGGSQEETIANDEQEQHAPVVEEQANDNEIKSQEESEVSLKHNREEEQQSLENGSEHVKSEQVFKKPKLPTESKSGHYEDEHETHENGDHDVDIDADAEAEDDGTLESEVEDNNEDEEEELEPEMDAVEEDNDEKQQTDTPGVDSTDNGLSPMEKERIRQDALAELTNIEVEFAQLRQSLYENKLSKLQNELQMCLDGSHPQLQTYYQKIASIRDFKLKRMYQRQKYELECIDTETRATRTFIHQDFYRKVSDLKHKLLGNTTQKWYDINKERREMDVVVPEVNYHVPIKISNKSLSCITGYAAPANLRRPGDLLSEDLLCENINFRYHNNPVDKLEVIVDRMRFNNELSDLDGIRKFYGGFPGAPELGGLKDSEIHEDLAGIQHQQ